MWISSPVPVSDTLNTARKINFIQFLKSRRANVSF